MENEIKQRLIYTTFLFLPLFLCFFMPLVLIKWPHALPRVAFNTTYWISAPAALYAFSIVMLWFVFAALPLVLPLKVRRPLRREWDPMIVFSTAILFTLLGLIAIFLFFYFSIPYSSRQMVHLFCFMSVIAAAFFIYTLKIERVRPLVKVLCIIGLFVNMSLIVLAPLTLGHASEAACGLAALLFALVLMCVSGKWFFTMLTVMFILVLALMLLKDSLTYAVGRPIMLSNGLTVKVVRDQRFLFELPTVRKVEGSFKQSYSAEMKNYQTLDLHFPRTGVFRFPYYVLKKTMLRLDRLSQFAYVLAVTPQQYPFLYGYTYKPLLTVFIPRVFWQGKPKDDIGHFYAHRYHYIRPENKVTSIALPYPLEAWINFGWPGIIISALLIGLIFRLVWNVFVGGHNAPGNIMLAMVIIYAASRGESCAYTVFGNLAQGLIFYWLLDVGIRLWQGRRHEVVCTDHR